MKSKFTVAACVIALVAISSCAGPKVRVSVPRESIFTCSEFIDHPIDRRTKFTSQTPYLFVVIALDTEFAGKKILLRIEKEGATVSEKSYNWEAIDDTHAFEENVKDLIAKAGYGKYRATYYLDGGKIAHTDFRIVQK